MRNLDLYYRAFKDYRKNTLEDPSCDRVRKEIARAHTDADRLETTKYLCTIEEDWVQAIEEGLTYVEKAVAEERQFIRTNGEVVPIEKVKKIAKDSVAHLAKHSDLITHLPEEEGADVIPDKLYMVEKLSDYAVYENRFLYMMLCYLNDFINYRLEKIEELRHTYLGDLFLSKQLVTKKRKLVVKTHIVDSRFDNEFPIADERSADIIERIKNCHRIVTSLLNTDLMTQVAKTPMIKPPITKTNVLKMNNNFKRALALYDYIASYKGLGYTYEEVHKNYAPFDDKMADEIAESVNLMTFLAYKYGNEIEQQLETAYQEEETRRQVEEAKKLDERIKRLKKRALESNKTLEEYMLLLEERNRMLEKDSEELQVIRQEVEALNHKIDDLNAEKAELNRRVNSLLATIEEKEQEIAALNQKYIEDMAALRKQHEEEKAAIEQAHAAQIDALHTQQAQEIMRLQTEFTEQIHELGKAHDEQVAALTSERDSVKAQWEKARYDLETGLAEVERRTANLDADRQKLVDEYEQKMRDVETRCRKELAAHDEAADKAIGEWEQETHMIRAELDAVRIKNGQMRPSTDYTSRERFVELEEEFEAFKLFFKGQWKLTKRAIRKETLSAKNTDSGSATGTSGDAL